MKIEINFKLDPLLEEFLHANTRIQTITCFVATLFAEHKHPMVVTCVRRTAAQQASLKAEGKTTATVSPHEDGRAVDIRLNDFPDKSKIKEMVETINRRYPRTDGRPTALAHGEGGNFHLHLQVPILK